MKKVSKSKKPRVLTRDEAREKMLLHFWNLVDYWDSIPDKTVDGFGGYYIHDRRSRLDGLMHSMLSALDGSTLSIPGMEIKPLVSTDDIVYYKSNGENWFPPDKDLGGSLHEIMYPIARKHGLYREMKHVEKSS